MTVALNQVLAQDEAEVFRLFLTHRARHGSAAQAMVFAKTFKDCDAYLDAADRVITTGQSFVRIRNKGNVAQWCFIDGATLTLDYLPTSNIAHMYQGRTCTFMSIHDPEAWNDILVTGWLPSLLQSTPVPPELITVRSYIRLPDHIHRTGDAKPINYADITRSICG